MYALNRHPMLFTILVLAANIGLTANAFADLQEQTFWVPSGDVDALYEAVYDSYGAPREQAWINLEPGTYLLEPGRPNGGRLILGDGTRLSGPRELPLDEDGIPTGDTPTDGMMALIDVSQLAGGSDAAWISVGDGGIVAGLHIRDSYPFSFDFFGRVVLDGSNRSAIVIVSKGRAEHNLIEGHSEGILLRAGSEERTQGTVKGNLLRWNNVGVLTAPIEAEFSVLAPVAKGSSRAHLTLRLEQNLVKANRLFGVNVQGGIGHDIRYQDNNDNGVFDPGIDVLVPIASHGNRTWVISRLNVINGGGNGSGMRVSGGRDNRTFAFFGLPTPGSNDNLVHITSISDHFADHFFSGLWLQAAILDFRGGIGAGTSSRNSVFMGLLHSEFAGNHFTAIEAEAALSGVGRNAGSDNVLDVTVRNSVIISGSPLVLGSNSTIRNFPAPPQESAMVDGNLLSLGNAQAFSSTNPQLIVIGWDGIETDDFFQPSGD